MIIDRRTKSLVPVWNFDIADGFLLWWNVYISWFLLKIEGVEDFGRADPHGRLNESACALDRLTPDISTTVDPVRCSAQCVRLPLFNRRLLPKFKLPDRWERTTIFAPIVVLVRRIMRDLDQLNMSVCPRSSLTFPSLFFQVPSLDLHTCESFGSDIDMYTEQWEDE